MRYFLTFIVAVILTFVWNSQSAVVSSQRLITVSPDAPAGSAATLTNVVKALVNNTTIELLPGTVTVQTRIDNVFLDNVAPILLTNLQNVTIRGSGWNSIIFSGQTGIVFKVRGCTNILFEDFAVAGTRSTSSLIGLVGEIHGTFYLETNNANIRFNRLKVTDQFDHVILGDGSSDVVVENSWFQNNGSTNNIGCCGRGDGSLMSVPGPRWTFRNNFVTNCAIGIELFTRFDDDRGHGKIIGNTFLGMHAEAVGTFGTLNEDSFNDILIADNIIRYNPATYWPIVATAFSLNQVKRVTIARNYVEGPESILVCEANLDCTDWTIEDNYFRGSKGQGVRIGSTAGLMVSGMNIVRNIFERTGHAGVGLFGGRHINIEGNTFNRVSTNNAGVGAIELETAGSLTTSNRIVNNRVYLDHDSTAQVPAYGVKIGSGVTSTLVFDNSFQNVATAGWSDSGTGSDFRNNVVSGAYVNPYLTNSAAGSGDSVVVNTTSVSDSVSLTNTTATSTVAGTTWSVAAAADPNPDRASVEISAASDTLAGIITADTQDIGGVKTFHGAVILNDALVVSGASLLSEMSAANATVDSLTAGVAGVTNNGPYIGVGTNNASIRLAGTNNGFFELKAPTSGQSNSLVPKIVAPLAGDLLMFHDVTAQGGTNSINVTNIASVGSGKVLREVFFEFALGDETNAIVTGTSFITWRAPYAFTVSAVRSSLSTASSSGLPTVDINEAGSTILSTKLTIDANEKTSTTAAAAAVISDTAIADDAEITFDIDTAGTGAKGLKVKIYGYR